MHFRFSTDVGETLGRNAARWAAAQKFELR